MIRVVILGSDISALKCAHSILDQNPLTEVKVYTEDAEVGFPEAPELDELVLEEVLPSIPSNWYSSIPLGIDQNTPSRVAGAWLSKAMAIHLTSRGGEFNLRTMILNIDEEQQEISFRGGGSDPFGVDKYDELYDFR